jgi:hypothetical protein
VDAWVAPHLARRRDGAAHPVEDFLFTYYTQRPSALRRWHPGYGVGLPASAAAELVGLKGYQVLPGSPPGEETVAVGEEYVAGQRPLLRALRTLLAATAARQPQLGCFGMHEWAMVYRQDRADVRHSAWPLRLGGSGTDEVVESHRIGCSHFDAFRFFTDEARPLNTLSPGRDDRAAFEQPGCLHAGMDLYKWSVKLGPLVPGELLLDAFELARDIRILDMRASPYDLADRGYSPVRIETKEGKAEYVSGQRAFSVRAEAIRARLLDVLA